MAPVPVYVKGGIWTNLEDQIVKAAIQKYGTHQWSKIASLLQKKSARQCEIRWNEYLNPKLNFTPFTKDEDTKLLDLARKLPNQWRSIADAMGRTAQACIDRYNRLLEGDNDDSSDLRLGSSIDFKVGDLNPKSETLVAKPDDVELADDEREMLAEARARLLNTQGKKATRKIRERMLEESKRIAQLQKRRELKQAGVKTGIRPGKKKYSTELDYNADVVYEQAPPSGIYDTSEEDVRLTREFKNFESNVERKGLKDKSNLPKSHKKEKQARSDRTQTVSTVQARDGSVLTNDYKKPVLSLPMPGTKRPAVEEKFETKRMKLLENTLTGAVFKENTETKLLVPEKIKKEEQNISINHIVKSTKSIRNLFAELPKPKNDFEIALDDEEDEESRNHDEFREEESNKEDLHLSGEISTPKEIALKLQCLNTQKDDLPPLRENPKNSFDQTYNELIACSMLNEPYIQSHDIEPYLEAVEMEIEKSKPLTARTVSIAEELPSQVQLSESIRKKMTTIKNLQEELAYLDPLIVRNDAISRQVCGQQLPTLRSLQLKHYVYYKMYLNESEGILQRRKRIKHDATTSTE